MDRLSRNPEKLANVGGIAASATAAEPVPSLELTVVEKCGGREDGCRYSARKEKRRKKSNAMTITHKGYRLGRRPGEQGPRPQPSDRGWVGKLATGEEESDQQRLKIAKSGLTVGTWNVRTMWATGQLELLRQEMKAYHYDILGLAEMRWTGSGELNNGEVIWSGEEHDHQRGVGFLLNSTAKAALLGYKPVNSRIIAARFSGQPLNLSVVQIYAPTADSTDEDIEEFYGGLEETLRELPRKDIKIICGDWNAKIGRDNVGWQHIMFKHGYGTRNERGERLLEFAAKHEMMICNTKFEQKDCRKYTWTSPDGKHTNMIDLVLIDRRWQTAVKLCRTFRGADISSDHNLVLCNLKLKLKRIPRGKHDKKRNIQALDNAEIRAQYEAQIASRIRDAEMAQLSMEGKVTILGEIIQQTVAEIIPLTEQPNKKWISEQTLELAGRKRKLRLTAKESEQAKAEYRKICNVVRTSARRDKQNWLEKQCEDIEQYAGEYKTREVFKMIKSISGKWHPRQTAIRDKHGNILMDREKIKDRWTEYCRELYSETEQTNRKLLEELRVITPPTEDDANDGILYEEVERAVKHLKKNKSPGTDGITAEMIQGGGEDMTKAIHEICKQVWREGTIPEEWTKSVLVTIPKKGDLTQCTNYRTIALVNHMGKVLMTILLSRLKAKTEDCLADEQAGFRKDRSTVQQILMLRLIAEKAKRKNKLVYNCFVDFQKAFDSIKHDVTWAVLGTYGVGQKLIGILKNIGDRSKSAVKAGREIGEWFSTTVGTRQGDPISPNTFIIYLERVMESIQDGGTGVSVQGEQINNLRFADDIDLLEYDCERLQESVSRLNTSAQRAGLKVNVDKTKTMIFGKKTIDREIKVQEELIENVTEFVYLGSLLTWDNDCTKEIKARIAKAKGVMAGLNNIWNSKQISYKTKLNVLRTCVFSTALYACETWTIKKVDREKILAFEMYCYRRMLHLNWKMKVTNKEIRSKLNIKEDLMQRVMGRKLGLFGHICRMDDDRKIKNVMLGIMEGKGRRGRPSREWIDDIRDWCNQDLYSLSVSARDRRLWKMVTQSALDTYGLSAHGS